MVIYYISHLREDLELYCAKKVLLSILALEKRLREFEIK